MDCVSLRTRDFCHKLVEHTQHELRMAVSCICRAKRRGLIQKSFHYSFTTIAMLSPGLVEQEIVTASSKKYRPSFHSEGPAQSDFHPCHHSKRDWNSSVRTRATKIYTLVFLFTTCRHVLSLSSISRWWSQEKERKYTCCLPASGLHVSSYCMEFFGIKNWWKSNN